MSHESVYRLPESPFRNAQTYSFTIYHGLMIRNDHGGFVIPDFQRPIVWTEAQKTLFVESVFLDLPIGAYCYNESLKKSTALSLLDGQQRWNAIYEFVDGKVRAFGYLWPELNQVEKLAFNNHVFPAIVVRNMDYAQQKEVFERLAYGGTPNVKS